MFPTRAETLALPPWRPHRPASRSSPMISVLQEVPQSTGNPVRCSSMRATLGAFAAAVQKILVDKDLRAA